MSVQFIGGKPGGGKSLLATRIILDELRRTNRYIITNLPLKLGEIADYFREQGWSWEHEGVTDVWLRNRICILTEEELPEFYRYRFPGCTPLAMTANKHGIPEHADYEALKKLPDYRPCLIVLDEVHIAFNSRRWQDTGPGVMYYLSQHRKLGDDVVLISQSIQNVDKQMRSVAQDFTYVRNLSKEQHGLFRLPSLFLKRVYLELPTGANVKAVQTNTFKLDVTGVARCYDTAAGVGVVGASGADTKERKRGLHWAWYVGAIVLVVGSIFRFAPEAIASCFKMRQPPGQLALAQAASVPVPAVVQAAPVPVPATNSLPRVTGFALLGNAWRFCLSDGRILWGYEVKFAPGQVVINGVSYEAAAGF